MDKRSEVYYKLGQALRNVKAFVRAFTIMYMRHVNILL